MMQLTKLGILLSLCTFGSIAAEPLRFIVYQVDSESIYCSASQDTQECFNLLNYDYPLPKSEVAFLAESSCFAGTPGCPEVEPPGEPMEY